ncbi:MAG: GAF domain-containing protein [Thermodesulfobacteriota bacterium]
MTDPPKTSAETTAGEQLQRDLACERQHCQELEAANAQLRSRIAELEETSQGQRTAQLAAVLLQVFVEETGDRLFDKALEVVQEALASRHGVFGYIDAQGHLVCPSLSRLLADCEVAGKCIHYPPEKWKGLWARALTERRALYSNEPPLVPDGHVAIANNLAAPILFQNRVVGLLNLANREGGFREADRELLEAIAHHIAPVLSVWVERKLREEERQAAEAERQRLAKALQALSNSRQAMVRAEGEGGFLQDVCRVIVEDCGYSMVWIGFAEDDPDKTVRPVAHAGLEDGYLDTLHLSWADNERGQGPTGTAIRLGRVAVCRSVRSDPAFAPWREQALSRGYASSIVFPLRAAGRVFGAISIYSREDDPFSDGEVKLLTELADDLAYGIMALRVRAAHAEAELALRQNEAKLRTIIDHLSEGLVVSDLAGNLFHWNPAALAMHGFGSLEEARRHLSEFTAIFELATAQDGILPLEHWPLARILRGETLAGWEVLVRRRDRSWQRVFSYGGTLARDKDGQPLLAIVTLSDITERKEAEEKLLRAKEDWERTFDAVPDLIAILDQEHRIVRANRAMAMRLGLSAEQCLNKRCFTCVHGTGAPAGLCPHVQTIKDGQEHQAELHIPRLGGDFLVTTTPLLGRDGTMTGTVHVARDITERKMAEEKVRRLNQDLSRSVLELEVANRELEAFSYSVSHDLRAPLRSIAGFSLAIKEDHAGRLDEEGQDALERVLAAAARMGQIIDDLLHLSQVTRSGIRRRRVSLSALAARIANSLLQDRPARQVELVIAPGVEVGADERLLHLALENLVGNAIKFTERQPWARIEVGMTGEGGERVYFVRDNGAGFDMRYSDRLFKPFQRLHSPGEFAGSGIGLATVRRIIDRHGGRVWIESQPGQGTVVFFTLGEGRPEPAGAANRRQSDGP